MIPKWPDDKKPHLRRSESNHWYRMIRNGEIGLTEFFDALNDLLERTKHIDDFCRVGQHSECMAKDCSCECHAGKAER